MPYTPAMAHGKTRKANTKNRSRQWVHVYDSAIQSGDDEGTAITKANGVVKKNWKKTNPSGRKPVDHRPMAMKKVADTLLEDVGRGTQTGAMTGAILGYMGSEAPPLPKGRFFRHVRARLPSAARGALELGLVGGALGATAHGVKRLFQGKREKAAELDRALGFAKQAGLPFTAAARSFSPMGPRGIYPGARNLVQKVPGSVGQGMTNAARLEKALKKVKPGSRRVANVLDRALEGTALNTRG